MEISKIEVNNYRLLKDFSIDMEDKLSLIIGKNNTGKTSILSILSKFLKEAKPNFRYDDFNIDFKGKLEELIKEEVEEETYGFQGVRLRIFISYTKKDNLKNISQVMMDLDPENNTVVLDFTYQLDYSALLKLKSDYAEFEQKEVQKKSEKEEKNEPYQVRSITDFLKKFHALYFKVGKYSLLFDRDSEKVITKDFIDLNEDNFKVQDLINFQYISAKRGVTNTESNRTLSGQTSRIYNRSAPNEDQLKKIEEFQDKLSQTDVDLSEIYKDLFSSILEKIKLFGGLRAEESEIDIISSLQHRELLEGNTTVVYKHDDTNQLPESYNGLGYLNLISMIFEIEILVEEFKRKQDERPSDINLLFIEEPEAHTHPQMQYVFIKNIKKLLGTGIEKEIDGNKKTWPLQYVISTHSSHIVADSDFDDIKYLKKEDNNIIAKNLKSLKIIYEDSNHYQFLKQYLTISRAEIFFADKAVLIEGDTERILVPTLMRKIDLEEKLQFEKASQKDPNLPLLSQNISIIEVGAYSQIFKNFIEFLGIKSLVLTDIDSIKSEEPEKSKPNTTACSVVEGSGTSNSAINHYFKNWPWDKIKSASIENRTLTYGKASLLVSYQLEEKGYHARSFEDAFIHINKEFINENIENFRGLKNRKDFKDKGNNAYVLAEKCIAKKTHFALDIIYHSNKKFSNWSIPHYIKEGLLWLKTE